MKEQPIVQEIPIQVRRHNMLRKKKQLKVIQEEVIEEMRNSEEQNAEEEIKVEVAHNRPLTILFEPTIGTEKPAQ